MQTKFLSAAKKSLRGGKSCATILCIKAPAGAEKLRRSQFGGSENEYKERIFKQPDGPRRRPEPGGAGVPPGGPGGPRLPGPRGGGPPGIHQGGRHGLPGGAGADHQVPRALGGRAGQRPREPGLPGPVQLRHRALQGRPAVPPQRVRGHHQVPGLRADLQKQPHRPAHRRRQGRGGL